MTRAALRATARIAWRQARLARGRSALIVAMIALPIAALTFGFTVIQTTIPTPEERALADMGTAELIIHGSSEGDFRAEQLLDDLPSGTIVSGFTIASTQVVADGTLHFPTFRQPKTPIEQPPLEGMWILESGRYPQRRGEAAVDPSVLETFDVAVGDTVKIGELKLRIVGVAVWPLEYWNPNLLVGPGTLDTVEAWDGGALIDLPPGADVTAAERVLAAVHGLEFDSRLTHGESAAEDKAVGTAFAFAAAAIALFATGLITGAAFAVGMRRQLRTLGLMGAAGAEIRHVRSTVLFSGTTLGAFGATLGAVAGLAAAAVVAPRMARLTGVVPGALAIRPSLIIGAIALGTIAATLAAVIPARAAARLSTVDALATRTPPPRPPGRIALAGVVIAGLGAPIAAAGAANGTGEGIVLSIGLLMMIGGVLLGIPLFVNAVGRAAHHLSVSWRVAARDTARQGRRTGAALAAAALALMFPVAVSATSLSEEAFERSRPRLGEHQLLFYNATDNTGIPAPLAPGFVDAIEEGLPGAFAAPVFPAVFGPDLVPADLFEPERTPSGKKRKRVPYEYPVYAEGPPHPSSSVGRPVHEGAAATSAGGSLVIATPDLLRAVDAAQAIPLLGSGRAIVLGVRGDTSLTMYLPSTNPEQPTRTVPAVGVDAPRYFNEDVPPYYLIDETTAADHGLLPASAPRVTLVWLPHAVTDADLEAAREIASRFEGMYVLSADDFIPSAAAVRSAALGASALIAIGILGVAVALVYAESRRDQAILGAVGAAPGTRRRIAGANAAILSLIAGVIGALAGFAPVGVIQSARSDIIGSGPRPVIVPWLAIAVVVVLVPIVAGLGAGVLSRKAKASAMLQPLT